MKSVETTERTEPESILIGIAETAEMLCLSLEALQLRIHRGTFPVQQFRFTPKGKRYFRSADVTAFIDKMGAH